jgi:hypothetical protein
MKLPLCGGCQCGGLRYEVRAEPLSVYVCHCTECQRQSGSAFGMSVIVPRPALAIIAGESRRWSRTSERGNVLDGDFCPICGTRIVHYPRINEAVAILKPGTLDDRNWLTPIGHIWTRSAQPWVPIPDDTLNFETHPDVAQLIEAWRSRRASSPPQPAP